MYIHIYIYIHIYQWFPYAYASYVEGPTGQCGMASLLSCPSCHYNHLKTTVLESAVILMSNLHDTVTWLYHYKQLTNRVSLGKPVSFASNEYNRIAGERDCSSIEDRRPRKHDRRR